MAKYSNSPVDAFLSIPASEFNEWRKSINSEIAIENEQIAEMHRNHGKKK